MNNFVLASNNQNKIIEFSKLLSDFNFYKLSDFTKQEPIEDGLSFVENAIIKARFASFNSNLPALADDSGLMVDALNGDPGIFSARFSDYKNDKANNIKLLNLMKNQKNRKAKFICVIVIVKNNKDPLPIIFQGIWNGYIAKEETGINGFGYDSLFIPDGFKITSAELDSEQKNKISHRYKAIEQMKLHYSVNKLK